MQVELQHNTLEVNLKPEFSMGQLCYIRGLLDGARRAAVVSHTNADGDAVGSVMGMTLMLRALYPQLEVTAMLPDGCPAQFGWMPLSAEILNGCTDAERCHEALTGADVVFVLDLNTPPRMESLATAFTASRAAKVLVDHHHSPDTETFDLIISEPLISSTCELVVWLADALWGEEAVSREAATCLYVGLRTDTGGFAFSNTQPSLYMAAAQLVATGIDPADINNRILNTFSENRLRFYGYAISNCLTVDREHSFAYFAISLDDQRHFGVGPEDMEGLVNYTLLMVDIECGALIREEENRCKVSLRSKYTTDVNSMARQLFDGGGHTKAAGATSKLTLQQTVKKLTDHIATR